MANIVREDNENLTAVITVNLAKADYEPAVKKELNSLRKTTNLKGFRKGMVPVSYLKKLYGNEVLSKNLNDLINKELYTYIEDNKLETLGQPMPIPVENQDIDINKLIDFSFKFELGLAPKIEIKGLDDSTSLPVHTIKVNKKLVDQEIKTWRKRIGKQSNPEDVGEEDVLTVNAVEFDGDKPKEGGVEKEIKMAVDLLKNKKLAKELLKLKKGDSFSLNIFELEDNKPEFIKKQILGVPVETEVNETFTATITDVERRELGTPSISQFKNAFGQDVFEKYFKDETIDEDPELDENGEPIVTEEEQKKVLAALSKKLKEDLAKYYEVSAERRMFKKLQERLTELNDFELPDEFLKRWLEAANDKVSKEEIEKEYVNFAKDLKWNLLKGKFCKELGVEVSGDDVVASFRQNIMQYFGGQVDGDRLDQLTQTVMEDKSAVEKRYQEMVSEKLFPAIKEKITLTEETISWEDFDELQKE